MPCFSTGWPVSIVAWADIVTAGTTSRIGVAGPSFASRGAYGNNRGVRPTALMRMKAAAMPLVVAGWANQSGITKPALALLWIIASAGPVAFHLNDVPACKK